MLITHISFLLKDIFAMYYLGVVLFFLSICEAEILYKNFSEFIHSVVPGDKYYFLSSHKQTAPSSRKVSYIRTRVMCAHMHANKITHGISPP